MDKEVIENLKDKGNLPKEMEVFIRKNGIITGSRVFGGFKSGESDIDIILNMAKFPWDFDDLMPYGYYISCDYRADGYASVYIKMNYSRHIHNLLLIEKDYEKWLYATETVKQIKRDSPDMKELLKSKTIRVLLFETLRDVSVGTSEPCNETIFDEDVPY